MLALKDKATERLNSSPNSFNVFGPPSCPYRVWKKCHDFRTGGSGGSRPDEEASHQWVW